MRVVATLTVVTLLMPAAAVAREDVPMPKRPAYGLPNLVMHRINDVAIAPYYTSEHEPVRGRWAVRFSSVVDNRGRGNFVLHLHRAAVGQPCQPVEDPHNRCETGDMTADQLVARKDGPARVYPGVGTAYFDADHAHWHLRGAERSALETPSGANVAPEVKTGFCYGDRLYYTRSQPPNYPGLQSDLVNCGPAQGDPATDGRRKLELLEGISAGWSDDYASYNANGTPVDGQQAEITGLRAGRYRLINEVNPDGTFKETTRRDNAAAVVFRLSWPGGGRPQIDLLGRCERKPRCRR